MFTNESCKYITVVTVHEVGTRVKPKARELRANVSKRSHATAYLHHTRAGKGTVCISASLHEVVSLLIQVVPLIYSKRLVTM